VEVRGNPPLHADALTLIKSTTYHYYHRVYPGLYYPDGGASRSFPHHLDEEMMDAKAEKIQKDDE